MSPKKTKSLLPEGVQILKTLLKPLPSVPGVYRMIDEEGEVLYVGKAKNIKKRVTSYTLWDPLPLRLKRMVSRVKSLEIITTHTEAEALLLEANLIKKFSPPYNVLLRDDKSFPYILIASDQQFPQILPHRGVKTRPGYYFGPFAESSLVHKTLPLLQRAFLLRSCSDSVFANRTRPCLLYHIKRCSAPCVQKISVEAYGDLVEESRQFLSGKTKAIQEDLAQKMMIESDQCHYEKAAVFRDRIRALTQIQQTQEVTTSMIDRADVIAFWEESGKVSIQVFMYQHGTNLGNSSYFLSSENETHLEALLTTFLIQFYMNHDVPPLILMNASLQEKTLIEEALSMLAKHPIKIDYPKRGFKSNLVKNALKNAVEALKRHRAERASQRMVLESIRDIFDLSSLPNRIEVYDNSHLQGQNPYGVMIVVGPEGFQKNAYRKFIIKNKNHAPEDDYAMMREVLTRRLKPLQLGEEGTLFPDLILLDGGKGHLKIGEDLFQEMGIQGIGLGAISKGVNRNQGDETLHRPKQEALKLESNDPVLFFMQQIRDEAHRFAITTHRKKRLKNITKSRLDEIDGIGHTRKKALLQHFGSLREIEKAGISDLQAVTGVSEGLAKSIYNYFHR
ncbi:MAG: excinuclease ABC subunit C [Alphaproteobacteria bacterium 16-39-46]|nr:MAG: excinuclease ABC subunit C [Alphaproteobacteria bacterium 16-39-46]OZA44017.1 MAG: excinuclease ABC subunit C [Alphaproteobacteria bacterium 17-39-52]HQS84189.1 excinuclease ABC subunit UvrC [Alphaproteobacteria bacterium]HQS93440.1 excinuclease ABC subunit UvrC [Alphaproteobacteria bacterium]